jgi:hypothetical protein
MAPPKIGLPALAPAVDNRRIAPASILARI